MVLVAARLRLLHVYANMDVEMKVHGIIAKISVDTMVDTGNGMAAWWKYPSEMRDIVPMARCISEDSPMSRDRLTVFDIDQVTTITGNPLDTQCEHVVVNAVISHLSYGTMQAREVVVIGTL